MSHVVRLGQHVLTLAVACIVLASATPLLSQAVHPLAQRLVNYSVAVEENKQLLSMERIPLSAYQEKTAALAAEARDINTPLRAFPRDVQAQIRQQSTSLFNVRIVPLREQWKQELAEKAKLDQARDAQRRVELTADAETAGKLQAARALIRERLQSNEISQAEAARADQAAEQQVLALQRKVRQLRHDLADELGRRVLACGRDRRVHHGGRRASSRATRRHAVRGRTRRTPGDGTDARDAAQFDLPGATGPDCTGGTGAEQRRADGADCDSSEVRSDRRLGRRFQ